MPLKQLEYPTFDTVKLERDYIKQHLAAACVSLGDLGFEDGVAGMLSVRDPEFTDRFWVNPFGVSLKTVTVSKLILINLEGSILEGDYSFNEETFLVHNAIYSTRDDVKAVVHGHPMYTKAYSSLGVMLDPITYESCAFYKDHSIYTDYEAEFVSSDEAKTIAYTLGENKACILQNHGLITVGTTIDEATWWLISMERSCQAQILADSCGKPLRIPNEIAEAKHSQVGTSFAGWLNFQQLYSNAIFSHPGIFD